MLVITRKLGERIVIDHDIEVRLIRVKPDRAMIGIIAPDDVTIKKRRAREYDQTKTEVNNDRDA